MGAPGISAALPPCFSQPPPSSLSSSSFSSPLSNGASVAAAAAAAKPAGFPSDTGAALLSAPASVNSDAGRDWVVCKFGGTSVGKSPLNIADIVRQVQLDHHCAVVCSARSATTKSEGSTNRLLRAAREAESVRPTEWQAILQAIRHDHVEAARANIRSPAVVKQLTTEIETTCEELDVLLQAGQVFREIGPKPLDTIISKGEVLACRYMAAVLRDQGIDAEFVDLSDVIDFPLPKRMVNQNFYDRLSDRLGQVANLPDGKVPVLTGYFGAIPGGLLNTIGRGYTDLCAALVAVGLRASELQIVKEVDGVFTADPRKVLTARLLPTITPAEAAELTFYGSEVIHPYTMEQVIRARIPIRIKNVMSPSGSGTTILPDPLTAHSIPQHSRPHVVSTPASPTPAGSPAPGTPQSPRSPLFRKRTSLNASARGLANGLPKRPTAITIKHKILVLNVHSNKRSISHGFFKTIFETLDRWRLSVDLISTSEVHVSMALHSESALVSGDEESKRIVHDDLKGAVNDLQQVGSVDLIDGMAILSLVGMQMKNMIGIAGRMFTVLGENNVNIEMISQGASEINISCVIEERDADRALNILHTHLFQFME